MSEKSLPPFNAVAKCPKCGGSECKTYYEPKIENDPCSFRRQQKGFPKHEFLLRTCHRCDYQWAEGVVKP